MPVDPNAAKAIFFAALEKSDAAERAAYVDQACAGDAALRERVEVLLKAHDDPTSFMGTPAGAAIGETQTVRTGTDDDAATEADSDSPEAILAALRPYLSPSNRSGALGRLAHYDVLEVLGRGAFGIVLKVFDDRLHRIVAIKVLAPELAAIGSARQRFLREARAVAAIRHEHVIDIHGVDEQPLPFLVMECIDGETLQKKIDATGPLEVKEVLRIGYQIASGLAAAHTQGQIHRDIKPSNVLLENGVERVKISDFGLARTVDDASLSQSGVIAGTPLYMAPEQASGGPIDHRADLFSLGSTLYAMCTGRPPFRGTSTLGILNRVATEQPRPIREVNPAIPEWLCDLIARLHAKAPEDRFQSAAEVAGVLAKHLAELQLHGTVRRSTSVPQPRARRRLWPVTATAVLCLLSALSVTEATGVTHLAGTAISIVTNKGTLIIEIDDPGVQVSLNGEKLTISGAGIDQFTLQPGQYEFMATRDGRPVKQELVTITRGGERVVTVSREAVGPVIALPAAAAERGAFVRLAGEAVAERRFDTLAEAVQNASDGDTIEILGNGPFVIEPINVGAQSLIVRAGAAFRPVLKSSQLKVPMLESSGRLVLEGIDFEALGHGPLDASTTLILNYNGPLFVANCSIRFEDQGEFWFWGLGALGARNCTIRNCFFAGQTTGFGCDQPLLSGTCTIENCIFAGNNLTGGYDRSDIRDLTFRLQSNTVVRQDFGVISIHPRAALDLAKYPKPIRVEASGNVFDSGGAFTTFPYPADVVTPLERTEAEDFLRRLLDWREQSNLYAGDTTAIHLEKAKDSPFRMNLAEWNEFWGATDSQSLSGTIRFAGGNLRQKLSAPGQWLTPEDFRLRADSAGYRAGPDGKDLGADVDLVGPGAAYEKWKKMPEYRQWLEETQQVND